MTDEQIEAAATKAGARWDGSNWMFEDADFHPFVRGILFEGRVRREREEDLQDVLHRNGFVRCDIAACNCGSWHARYGLAERFSELNQAMLDADEQMNGVTLLGAVKALIAERDSMRAALTPAAAPPCSAPPHPPAV